MMDKISLQNIVLFKSLSPQILKELESSMQLKTLLDGEILFRENEPGSCFYIIMSGKIEVVKALGTTEERMLNVLEPGMFMGELSLMVKDSLRTASARALNATSLLELSRDKFEQMIETQPTIALQIMKEVCERLRTSDESIIHDLRKKNIELAKAYDDLKAAQNKLIEKEKLEHELNMAREIQMSILPQKIILPQGCEIGAKMVPAKAVGGDFYDIIPLDDFRVGIAIGDVSDKGIAAAMFMAQFCTLLRIEANQTSSPARVLSRVNNHLLGANSAQLFVTCIYGIYDIRNNSFSYARAGHELPLIFDQDKNFHKVIRQKGTALCLFSDPPIDVQTIMLPSNGILLMYTDGGTDAINKKGDQFGLANMKETLLQFFNNPAMEICEKIVNKIISFQKGTQFDDVTIVVLRATADVTEF
ncbi:MAG: SpoIIE family protein phosphatase [Desulfobacula sp.]|nr:SpoIIE family protein phosphatase [Desulfobacula sp.]